MIWRARLHCEARLTRDPRILHARADNRMFSPMEVQKQAFDEQMQLAQELQLPAFLHCRDAFEDFVEILSRYPGVKKCVHWWVLPSLVQEARYADTEKVPLACRLARPQSYRSGPCAPGRPPCTAKLRNRHHRLGSRRSTGQGAGRPCTTHPARPPHDRDRCAVPHPAQHASTSAAQERAGPPALGAQEGGRVLWRAGGGNRAGDNGECEEVF